MRDPLRTKEFAEKNIVTHVLDAGHFGDVSVASSIKEKCLFLAFMDFCVMDMSKDIRIVE